VADADPAWVAFDLNLQLTAGTGRCSSGRPADIRWLHWGAPACLQAFRRSIRRRPIAAMHPCVGSSKRAGGMLNPARAPGLAPILGPQEGASDLRQLQHASNTRHVHFDQWKFIVAFTPTYRCASRGTCKRV
jgi:hypothetical protein